MAARLCGDLKKARLDDVTMLIIVLFISHFDFGDLGYADFVSQDRIQISSLIHCKFMFTVPKRYFLKARHIF